MEIRSVPVVLNYVNRFVYPQFSSLWKEAVEKAVENVEKCEFSTDIFASPASGPAVENFA